MIRCRLTELQPRRIKRSADVEISMDEDEYQDEDENEEIEYQRASNVMQELLRISRSIDDIENENDQRHNKRSKRDTGNNMNNIIQVSYRLESGCVRERKPQY